MNKSFSTVSFFSMLFLTACVTINIYFPAAAAEQVADEIIQGIQDENGVDALTREPEAGLSNWQLLGRQWLEGMLNVFVAPAYAGEANLDIDTAEIRKLRAAMKKRYPSLLPFYTHGYIGIQSDGLLALRNADKIPLKDRNKAGKLAKAENSDRTKLYQSIANANGQPGWSQQIKSTFAQSWIDNARSGWWYQSSNGNWKQK